MSYKSPLKKLLLTLMLCGCQAERLPEKIRHTNIPPEPKCTCPDHTQHFYFTNLEFLDEKGTLRTFPYKVTKLYYGTHYVVNEWRKLPETMYAVKKSGLDGVNWYFAIKEPERKTNGLLEVEQVDGPVVGIDDTGIEVFHWPFKEAPLNEEAQKIVDSLHKMKWHRAKACPLHRNGGWLDKYDGFDCE